MVAVDAAATKAGKTSDEDYIAEWREEKRPCGPDIQAEAETEAMSITQSYPSNLIKTYVRNEGWTPERLV